MAVFENYPYTNLHNLNLDFIIKEVQKSSAKVDELAVFIDQNISELVAQYIQQNIDRYYINAVYDEDTRSLLINLEEV